MTPVCLGVAFLFVNCYLSIAIQNDNLLPYGISKGDLVLKEGDDEVSMALKLKKPLQFFDMQFNIVYVSTNGILSPQPPPGDDQYVNSAFPLSFPAIAPFLADIDTSEGGGTVFYRSEESQDALRSVAQIVHSGFPRTKFRPTHSVIATWLNVAPYKETTRQCENCTKVNTFQAVLVSNKTDTYAVFLYPEDGLQFHRSRLKNSPNSKFVLARVGFSRGDTSTTQELFHSLSSSEESIKKLSQEGNSGLKGVWVFHIGSSRFSFQRVVPAVVVRVTPVTSVPRLNSGIGATQKTKFGHTDEDVYSMDNSSASTQPFSFSHREAPEFSAPEPPRLDTLQSPSGLFNTAEICGTFLEQCSKDGYCTDYSAGPCCHCRTGFYGNGRQCLPKGVSQRLNGKLRGHVTIGDTKVKMNGVDLHGYAVVEEGRVYLSISPVPQRAGWALMTVNPLMSTLGWLFALELRNHPNGFSITGSEFTHHIEMTFYPGNQKLTIELEAQGVDSFNHIKTETHIHGDLPDIPVGAKVQMQPYKETYQYSNSVVTSSSLHKYTVVSENGGSERFSYLLHQNITFQGCKHGPWTIPEFQQLNVEHTLVMTSDEGRTIRFAVINSVGPVGGELPELLELNPCSSGMHYCDPMALCLPGEGLQYHCQCAMGFRGDGRNCYDVDECAEGLNTCGPHSECVNIPGSHLCHCDSGYEFDFDWRVCSDIDECLLQLCHPLASCSNSLGSFHCQCWPGYDGDGFLCQPKKMPRPALTVCQQHRDSLQEGLGSWEGQPNMGAFIPECDRVGQYRPLQCLGSSGHCWCVDSRGHERAGTRVLPGTPPINCDQPAPLVPRAETLCERWRLTLLSHYGGKPSPQDYMPQCDAKGHFLPLQCYGNSRFCWCVDRQGREVTGTRSHDSVRPACISSVPPFLAPSLVHTEVNAVPSGSAILYAQGAQIGVIPLNGIRLDHDKSYLLLAQMDSIVIGMDYDCKDNQLYWTDLARQSICRVRLVTGSEPETVIHSELSCPEGVAVDIIHRRLFWVDSGTDRIETSELDGHGRAVLFDSDLVNPRAIIVDADNGILFWADWNRDDPKIECSTLDGKKRKVLVRKGLSLPSALTLEPTSHHLCWADAGTNKLECISQDGTKRQEISNNFDYPFSLVTYSNHLYYTDWMRDGILVFDKNTSKHVDYLPIQRSNLFGITVISSDCTYGHN